MLERERNLKNRNINLFNHRGQTIHIEANGAAGFLFVNMAAFHCCLVAKSCLTFCDPMDCSKPGFPVPHHFPGFAQVHIHCISDAIQPSHDLLYVAPFYRKQKCNAYFFFFPLGYSWGTEYSADTIFLKAGILVYLNQSYIPSRWHTIEAPSKYLNDWLNEEILAGIIERSKVLS